MRYPFQCGKCRQGFLSADEFIGHFSAGMDCPFLPVPEPVSSSGHSYEDILKKQSKKFRVYKKYVGRTNPAEPNNIWSMK